MDSYIKNVFQVIHWLFQCDFYFAFFVKHYLLRISVFKTCFLQFIFTKNVNHYTKCFILIQKSNEYNIGWDVECTIHKGVVDNI